MYTGETYEGDFMDGKRHGKGEVMIKEGHKLVGQFVEGRFTGDGSMSHK